MKALLDLLHTPTHRTQTGEALAEIADLSSPFGLRGLRVSHDILKPGHRSAPPHRHTETEEFILVLDGQVTVALGDQVRELQAGEMFGFPAGGSDCHEVMNRSQQPAMIVSVASVGRSDETIFGAESLLPPVRAD